MSSEFIQFDFPCIDCLVKSCCGDKPNIKSEEIYGHNLHRGAACLAIPEADGDTSYQKALLECWVNFGNSIMEALPKDEFPNGSGIEKNNNLPIPYIRLLQSIVPILQWIVNSTSWEEGKLFDFDKYEVNKVIEKLKLY